MALFAQHEAVQVSKRTQVPLAQKKAKARGFMLGKPENFTNLHRTQSVVVIKENARVHPADRQASELIRLYQLNQLSLREIAERLNKHDLRTRYGKLFKSETVQRILKRHDQLPVYVA